MVGGGVGEVVGGSVRAVVGKAVGAAVDGSVRATVGRVVGVVVGVGGGIGAVVGEAEGVGVVASVEGGLLGRGWIASEALLLAGEGVGDDVLEPASGNVCARVTRV